MHTPGKIFDNYNATHNPIHWRKREAWAREHADRTAGKERERWLYAARCYRHLVTCLLKHTSLPYDIDPREKCRSVSSYELVHTEGDGQLEVGDESELRHC